MRRLGTFMICLALLLPAGVPAGAAPMPTPTYELPDGITAVQAACTDAAVPMPGLVISAAVDTANGVGPPMVSLGSGSRWVSADSDSVPGLAVALGSVLDFADVSVTSFQVSWTTFAITVETSIHGTFRLRQDRYDGTGWPWVEHRSSDQWNWSGRWSGFGTLDEFVDQYGDGPATGYVWAGDCNGDYPSYPNPTYIDGFAYGSDEARTSIDFEPIPTSVTLTSGPVRRDGARTLSCLLRDPDGRRLADEYMTLTARPWSSAAEPDQAGVATTGADGRAAFRVRPRTPMRYRCEFPGSVYGWSLSSWAPARIRPTVTADLTRRDGDVRVRGTATPAAPGTSVVLHVRHGSTTTAVRGRLRSRGGYALRAPLPPGRSRLWVTVAAGPGTTSTASKAVTVRRP